MIRKPPFRKPWRLELLEDRLAPAIFEFVNPNPSPGNISQFGASVVPLSTGNVVITAPADNFNGIATGAVYLFNGSTGALISTIRGTSPNDGVGSAGVVALTNGNFVILSTAWDNLGLTDAGAVTWGNGVTGVNGTVSAANSLVGGQAFDIIGSGGVTPLSNGNYVVRSPAWKNGAALNAGAVTWGSGMAGVSGTVGISNSLIGATAGDSMQNSVVALPNGNYVVNQPFWDVGEFGAVTFVNGTVGLSGLISSLNSLIGVASADEIGLGGITILSNGNYIVSSPVWNDGTLADAGAATYCSGTTGLVGTLNSANSLVGGLPFDRVSAGGVTALSNGNYVVSTPSYDLPAMPTPIADLGVVTFCNGITGTFGGVGAGINLIGGQTGDMVGSGGAAALTNGNYVVCSPNWKNAAIVNAGAVTLCNGVTGTAAVVSAANSLVGSTGNDSIGNAGAVPFVNGGGVTPLTNGNYIVRSPNWDNGAFSNAGAVTWGNGATGIVGAITAANSLVGGANSDLIGFHSVTPLYNGHFVVRSPNWDNGAAVNAGAATWGNGATGISGLITAINSLVGSKSNDSVGIDGVTTLANGNYIVGSQFWDNGATSNAGAVTWGNGATGIVGAITAANSLVGSVASDQLGSSGVLAFANSNYAVSSPNWDNGPASGAGAVTFGNGATGTVGLVANSIAAAGIGSSTSLGSSVADSVNSQFYGRFVLEGGGRVRVGSMTTGFVPPCVTQVKINNGDVQRSRVTTISIAFDQRITVSAAPATVFSFIRQSDSGVVSHSTNFDSTGPGTVVEFTFTGGPVESDSLADGRYTLTINSLLLNNGFFKLDGDCDGTGGDNYVLACEPDTMLPPTNIFRLFGDATGDGSVSNADFNIFRNAFGGTDNTFDFDNDGSVSNNDFNQFKTRFGASI